MKNKGLGRGLSALISDQYVSEIKDDINSIVEIDIMQIEASKFQPRKYFDEESITELADSIMRHGIIQPIVLRKTPGSSKYQIIAGERRWRAAKISGILTVPAIIKNVEDSAVAEQALIENIQRENLNPLEEAEAYLELMGTHGYNQEQLAKSIGKNRSHVANMIRINMLPEAAKSYVKNNQLSFSHAKVIAAHDDAGEMAKEIVERNLNVRQTEHLVKNWKKQKSGISKSKNLPEQNTEEDILLLENSLTETLGLKVTINSEGNRGKIVIHYNNYQQLDSVFRKLSTDGN